MDEPDFQERIAREIKAQRTALAVLGLEQGATEREARAAFRRAAFEHHPDRNAGAPDASRRFRAATRAFRYLTGSASADVVLETEEGPVPHPEDEHYDLSNRWGFFLWWRERFFPKD